MKTCRHYRHLIAAFVDGTASADEVAALAAHRAECPHCDAYARELRRTRDLVRGLPRLEPSSPILPGVSARLRAQKVSWLGGLFCAFRMSDMRMPAVVAVLLVLLIGAGVALVNGTPPLAGPTVANVSPAHLGVYSPPAVASVINAAPLDDYYISCQRYHQAYASAEDVQLASY
jgi:anti-sigma factor RsiW